MFLKLPPENYFFPIALNLLAEFRFMSWKSVCHKTISPLSPAAWSEKKQILQSKLSFAVTFAAHCP